MAEIKRLYGLQFTQPGTIPNGSPVSLSVREGQPIAMIIGGSEAFDCAGARVRLMSTIYVLGGRLPQYGPDAWEIASTEHVMQGFDANKAFDVGDRPPGAST